MPLPSYLTWPAGLSRSASFIFFGVAQSHFEPVDVDGYLFVEVTIVDR